MSELLALLELLASSLVSVSEEHAPATPTTDNPATHAATDSTREPSRLSSASPQWGQLVSTE